MNPLSVQGLHKRYGRVPVLTGISLDLDEGTTTAILGPSGCGKTTLLRLIAGFDRPDAGTIALTGHRIASGRRALPPNKRNIGYVAQEGALFPHLSVGANIGFGLSRRLTTVDRRQRVTELLDLVSLDRSLTNRSPHELSGGQQQRVALARALARRPALVLLDEPFTSLDTGLRAATRTAVLDALRAERVTTLLVTHDQHEAMSMADQVAVMAHGTFTQIGAARELYARPATLHAARMLGPGTLITGTVHNGVFGCALGNLPLALPCGEGAATAYLRPEQVRLAETGVPAVVRSSGFSGADTMLTARLDDDTTIDARVEGAIQLEVGQRISVAVEHPVLAYPLPAGGPERGHHTPAA